MVRVIPVVPLSGLGPVSDAAERCIILREAGVKGVKRWRVVAL